jgi:hemerythrin-like domain-containing protein
MNLDQLSPGLDDPVDALLGFHRRIERQLAALARLPCDLEEHGLDAQASGSAASILEFFTRSIAMHHADEEALLPMLEMRAATAAERERIRSLRDRLEMEHRDMERTWRGLRRPLEGLAEGMQRRLPADLVAYFRAIHSTHISAEESNLHLSAALSLLPADRAALGRGMAARRTRRFG